MGNIEHSALQAEGIHFELGEKSAVLTVDRLRLLGREFKSVRAECSTLLRQSGSLECRRATLSADGLKDSLPLRFSLRGGALILDLFPDSGERWHLERSARGEISVNIQAGKIGRLQGLLPLPADWKIGGLLDARVRLNERNLSAELHLQEASFTDVAGLHAGEKLAALIRFSARRQGAGWDWQSESSWSGGEFFWQPLYAKAEGQTLSARGRLQGERLEIVEARLRLPRVGDISGGLAWSLADKKLLSARLESSGLDLATGGVAYLMPILAEQGVPEMRFGGQLSFSLQWDGKGLQSVVVGLNDISLVEVQGRFAIDGIHGGLPWNRDAGVEGYLNVKSAVMGGFSFDAFELPLLIEPQKFTVARASIPVLGSQLNIERLVWRKSTKRQAWEGDLSLSLQPVSLEELTRAAGLPKMSGTLSASFPHLRYREGAAYLDGALVIQVFEGYLNCTHLRLEDPFGTLPRLTADIDVQRLNLGQLTETFSFGRITGFADAEIKGLELAAWKPLRFDAKVLSASGDYRKRISQRAVQNISSLGGAGAGAAIQATFLRFFEEFGYDKIGISCQMRDGVCTMGGVEDVPAGYVMVKGGGLPALTVIGYNRQVDWAELVSRLQGIVQNNIQPVFK